MIVSKRAKLTEWSKVTPVVVSYIVQTTVINTTVLFH